MFRSKKSRSPRRPGSPAMPKSPRRLSRSSLYRRLGLEVMEDRRMLTANLFLDFGDSFPAGGFTITADDMQDTFAAGGIQGPNFLGDGATADPVVAGSLLTFNSLSTLIASAFDYNNDGATTAQDYQDLRADVVQLVQRYYAPFDVNVQVAPPLANGSSAAYLAGIQTQLQLGANVDGERDAWVFISNATRLVNGVVTSLGNDLTLFGKAPSADLPGGGGAAQPNARDDSVVVFADNILDGLTGSAIFDADTHLAHVAAHEAAHSFGSWHTWDGIQDDVVDVIDGAAGAAAITVRGYIAPDLVVGNTLNVLDASSTQLGTFTIRAGSSFNSVTGLTTINVAEAIVNGGNVDANADEIALTYTTNQRRVVLNDVIVEGGNQTPLLENFNFFTRYPLLTQDDIDFAGDDLDYVPFDLLARDENLGLRSGGPAYVTGTGAFDRITIGFAGLGFAAVLVEPFQSASFLIQAGEPFIYAISTTNGILIEAGSSDDRIIIDGSLGVNVTVRGMAGNDTLVVQGNGAANGSYLPASAVEAGHPFGNGLDELDSLAGTVTVGATTIDFAEFEPLVISGVGSFTFITPNAADVLTVDSPAAGQNRISGSSGGVPFEAITFFDVTNFTVDMATNDGSGANDLFTIAPPGLVASGLAMFTVNGGPGNDVFRVRSSATAIINVNGGPPVVGDPEVPPGDVLTVDDIAGAIFDPTATDGSILIPGRAAINYTSIETIIAPDRFEVNNTIASATVLGSDPFVTLRDLSIHNGTDLDFFRYTAHDTGKLIVRTLFDDAIGNIDFQILDSSGDVIVASVGADDGDERSAPVVAQQTYFVRVFGVNGAINNYSLEIENFPAPAPTGVHLDPASDTGLSNHDGVTGDTTPTFFIQTDVLEFVDVNQSGVVDPTEIVVLTAAQAAAGNVSGIGVEVTLVNTTTGTSLVRFANPLIAAIPEVYRLDVGAADALAPGVYLISARLKVFDGRQNPPGTPLPVMGRSTASPPLWITIAADETAPRVNAVQVTGFPGFNLFDTKPTAGPTPLVNSLTLQIIDGPNRFAGFLTEALNASIASSVGHYRLVGDHVGFVNIVSATVTNLPPVVGAPAQATIVLQFASPLPDDRFTLTVFDNIVDLNGFHLDGESGAVAPGGAVFPSGDGVPGGDFVARFTVDSRPEIASVIPQQINIDINGNFVWDPANGQIGNDATNVDLTFTMQVATGAAGTTAPGGFGTHDLVFAGRFLNPIPTAAAPTRVFDQLAVYGNAQDLSSFRWLVDRNSDGIINVAQGDVLMLQPVGGLPGNFNVQSALPIAGNFDGNAANGDEIGLYNAGRWALDSNRNFVIDAGDTFINNGLLGHPTVGDFDGDGLDDLAVFNANVFSFDLANSGFGGVNATLIWGFPGVLDRPVAADMDQDGIDDIGLWVPRNNAQDPTATAEWYFLISGDFMLTDGVNDRVTGTINTLNHPYEPVPFGRDLYAEFGNERALPLVGNFDPPVAAAGSTTPPVTPATSPDLNGDGAVNGNDFLAWQRGGANAATLSQWKSAFGQGSTTAAVTTTATTTTTTAAATTTSNVSTAELAALASAVVAATPAAPTTQAPAPQAIAPPTATAVDAVFSTYSRSRSHRALVSAKSALVVVKSSLVNPSVSAATKVDDVVAETPAAASVSATTNAGAGPRARRRAIQFRR
jgi:hypothetical protein